MNSKNLLITGIDSFTGPYLKKKFELLEFNVFGTSFNKKNLKEKIFNVDINDSKSLNNLVNRLKPNYVIHLSAMTHVQIGEPKDIYETNIIGTYNLLNALYKFSPDVNSILLISSANIYGNNDSVKISEDAKPSPQNVYASSKFMMEIMVKNWLKLLPINIVRPFNYTGVGQSENFVIPKIINHFKRRDKEIYLGNIDISRDFSDVRDITNIYSEILLSNIQNETLNICSGKLYSLRDVINFCKKYTSHNISVFQDDKLIRRNEIKELGGSNHKIKSLFPKLESIDFFDTLEWMLKN